MRHRSERRLGAVGIGVLLDVPPFVGVDEDGRPSVASDSKVAVHDATVNHFRDQLQRLIGERAVARVAVHVVGEHLLVARPFEDLDKRVHPPVVMIGSAARSIATTLSLLSASTPPQSKRKSRSTIFLAISHHSIRLEGVPRPNAVASVLYAAILPLRQT